MILTIAVLLAGLALVVAVTSAVRPAPILWVAVVLLAILALLQAGIQLQH